MNFARVEALIGAGLRDFSFACDEPLLRELLMKARARFSPPVDVVIERVCSAPFSEWSPGHVRMGFDDHFGAREVVNDVARTLTATLLGQCARRHGRVVYGNRDWPFGPAREGGHVNERPTRLGHVLVVGLGSIGSEVVRQLDAERITLVDDARVSALNPVRQWYDVRDVGRFKAEVLAAKVPGAVAHVQRIDGAQQAAALITRVRPDLAVLATGTEQHGYLAEALGDTPYVAACAYPQARAFEVIMNHWHAYRRQTYAPQVSDEVARFLYALPESAERRATVRELTAEPALASATMRVADVAARCVQGLVSEPPWLRRMRQEGSWCLLGANVDEGERVAGQVLRVRPGQTVF